MRFALMDRTVALEDVLKALADGGPGGAPPRGRAPTESVSPSRGRSSVLSGKGGPTASATPDSPSVSPPVASFMARDVGVEARPGRNPADLNAVTGRWDDLVSRVRGTGKALLAAALEASSPVAITPKGDLTIELDEPNDFHAKAIEQSREDVLAILGEWFEGTHGLRLFRDGAPQQPGAKPKRVTDDMVQTGRLNALRRKDPVLDAAIDILDLEIEQ